MQEELYFAYILRYHRYTGQPSIARSFQAILDTSTRGSSVIFLSSVNKSIQRLGLFETEYIEEHSILPFYRIFLKEKKYQKVEHLFLYGRCISYVREFHHTFNKEDSLTNNFLKYCPVCHREERGYLDIKKHHQIPWVKVCEKHHCYLKEISTENGIQLSHPEQWDVSARECKDEWLLGIAEDVRYILQERPRIYREWIVGKIREEIQRLQEISGLEAMEQILKKAYETLPEEYQCYRRRFRLEKFLEPLLDFSVSQMEFLLLIRILFGSFEDFVRS